MSKRLILLALLFAAGQFGCQPQGASNSAANLDAELAAIKEEARAARERADAAERSAAAAQEQLARLSQTESPAGAETTAPEPSTPALPVPMKKRGSRSQPGTLVVEMTAQKGVTVFDRPPGPWLYIDGRLIRDYSDREWSFGALTVSESLSLVPGEYNVEMVAAGTHYNDSGDRPTKTRFVLNVEKRQVKVEPEKTAQVNHTFQEMMVVHRENPYSGLTAALAPRECTGWARRWQDTAQDQMKLYNNDALVIALKQLDASLGSRPPEKSVVMLDIPEVYGGRREVNANQVRLIVDWIEGHYWGNWPPNFEYGLDLEYVGDVKEEYRQVKLCDEVVKQHRDEIQQLKSVARKLDQARM